MNKLFCVLVIFGLVFVVGSCGNQAASRLADNVFEDRADLIIDNPKFTAKEKELYLINVLQALGKSQKEITAWIKNYKEEQKGKK